MTTQHYTATLLVDAPQQEVFRSINNVSRWWTEHIEGSSEQLGDEFTVRFGEVHMSAQKLVELLPDTKVVWLVTDSKLNFVEDQQEWTGTRIIFELSAVDGKTRLLFTHEGLVPQVQCYEGCSRGWDQYIKGSLYRLLTEGKGNPGLK